MANYYFKAARLMRGTDIYAQGVLIRVEALNEIIWYSPRDSDYKPNGGHFEEFELNPNEYPHWNYGSYPTIDEMATAWNSGDREPCAMEEENSTLEFEVEKGAEHKWTNGLGEGCFSVNVSEWIRPKTKSEFVSDKYTQTNLYVGQGNYHSHHGQTPNMPVQEGWKGHRIGVELEVEAKNSAEFEKIKKFKSNWFYQERDGSLGSYGDEFITIPLLPKDAKDVTFWEVLTLKLNKSANSWNRNTCGLHVHIGREILGKDAEQRSETLGKLLYFYHHLIQDNPTAKALNERVYGRAHTYSETSGKSKYGEAVEVIGQEILKDKGICDKLKKSMFDASGRGRYYDINLENTATIEFRKGKGSISAERITAIIAWSEAMCEYCRKTTWLNLSFTEFVSWVKERRGTPNSLKGFLAEDM